MMVDKSLLVLELWKDVDQFKSSVVKLQECPFTQIFDTAVHPPGLLQKTIGIKTFSSAQ